MAKKTTIGDLVNFKRGYDLPHSQREDGEFPVVSSGGFSGNHKFYKAKAPGVVTGRYGTLGEVFYVDSDYWPLNTSLYVQDFKGNNPKFIYYYLGTVLSSNFNSAGAVPGVNRNYLHKIEVPCPPKEQEKIVAILSAYDDLIENNKRRIALLEKMAEEIYREWFVRMRFPGHEQVAFHKGIPEGWEIKIIKDFGSVVTGKTPSTQISGYYGGDFPFIKTPDMHGNLFILRTEETLSQSGFDSQKRQILGKNVICVNCIGALSGSVSITTTDCQTNQQINSLTPEKPYCREFLFFSLRNLKEKIHLFGNTGSTMTNLSKGKFENLEILKPSSEILDDYHEVAKPIFEKIRLLGIQNQNLEQTRDRLLPRLISGKLAVEDLDIQFPPSMSAAEAVTHER
jgi:type I restriction enzyme, S subunit